MQQKNSSTSEAFLSISLPYYAPSLNYKGVWAPRSWAIVTEIPRTPIPSMVAPEFSLSHYSHLI